jgi:type VI secretion system protein ImpH
MSRNPTANPTACLAPLTPHKTFFELMRRFDALHHRQQVPGLRQRRRRPVWLRMEQSAAMHFASTEVAAVQVVSPAFGASDVWPEVRVELRHFGLFAPYGALPLHITEHAMREKGFERNGAFEQFVNVVSSDMAWLHYTAWAAMHPALGYERDRNAFIDRIGGMAWVDAPGVHGASTARGSAGNPHAQACRRSWPGLYIAPHRPMANLQRLLRAYFKTPVQLLPRGGRWLAVPATGREGQRLGRWRLGSRVWDAQNTLDIEIGPIDAGAFHLWQRRAPATRALVAVVADYAGGSVQAAVHVQVRTRPELAARVGRTRVGVDAWANPGHVLRRLTVHEASQDAP